jgi:hypothetical protein
VFPLAEERVGKLKAALEVALQAAGIIHSEYNIEACFVDDKPFIIEINPRQGGNDLPRYVQEHCGIDFYRLLVTTSVGDDEYWESLSSFKRERRLITHHMLYPKKTGRFKDLQIAEELKDCVGRTQINVNVGNEIRQATDGSASIGYVDLVFGGLVEQSVSNRLEDLIRIEIEAG